MNTAYVFESVFPRACSEECNDVSYLNSFAVYGITNFMSRFPQGFSGLIYDYKIQNID